MDPTIDQLRERLAAIAVELANNSDPTTREALETEQADLRARVQACFSVHPQGRAMLEEELATLERQLEHLVSQQIKKTRTSLGGGSPSGGGLEPRDVQYLRAVHERWNNMPALRARIKELRNRLNR
ncbi:MAG: hypothetical protein GWP04_08525 [Gammaproteobacteria bacterium]|nr:hypothetical protein [Gammaproteobacteria bacterium]